MTRPLKDQSWRHGICEMCGEPFLRHVRTSRYCGSARRREGCSYKNQLIKARMWAVEHPARTAEISRDSFKRRYIPHPRKRKSRIVN